MHWKAYKIFYTVELVRIQNKLRIKLNMNSVTLALLTLEYFLEKHLGHQKS
jgi:hypothetical protein